jgi:hypothetical protein
VVAQLVDPDDIVFHDKTITAEEAKQIAFGLALGEADIEAGRVLTLDEASIVSDSCGIQGVRRYKIRSHVTRSQIEVKLHA